MKLRFLAALLACLLPLCALAEGCPVHKMPEDYAVQPLAESPAGDAAFADALLIGDSIAGSVVDYNAFPALEVEAYIGLSPVHAHRSRIIRRGGEFVSLYQLAVMAKPDQLYILLGSNALGYADAAAVLPDYHALVDDLVRNLPDTDIYILAVTPVGKDAVHVQPQLTNDNIRAFNAGLLEMAEAHGIYYIDSFTPLLDAAGEAAYKDYVAHGESVHLTRKGIDVLVETIRLHTIHEGGTP